MPWSPAAHAFFSLCSHAPEKARKKCPDRSDAKRMAAEGIKARGVTRAKRAKRAR